MKIAVDLDDVLVEFNKGLMGYINSKYGKNFDFDSITSHDYTKCLQVTRDEISNMILNFYGSKEFKEICTIPDAVESIDLLSKSHEIFIVSARPHSLKPMTEEYLKEKFNNKFKEVIFTNAYDEFKDGNTRKKSEVCIENEIDLFIDDVPEYIEDVLLTGTKCIIFERPWNLSYKQPKNVKRVKRWKEIVDEIRI